MKSNKRLISSCLILIVSFVILFFNLSQLIIIKAAEVFRLNISTEFWTLGIEQATRQLACLGVVFFLISSQIRNKYQYATGVIILFFFYCILKDSVNIPINDDYHTILNFTNRFITADSLSEKFNVLFERHWECRLVFTHIICLTVYFIAGEISFPALLIIGNLGTLACWYLLILRCRNKFRPRFMLITAFIIFQFQYYDAIFWATDALHYPWVLFFSLLSFHFADQTGKKNFLLAGLFAGLALLTFGNGVYAIVTGAMILLYRKRYRDLSVWILLFTVILFLYFYGYHSPYPFTPGKINIGNIFIYSFSFLGSAMQFGNQPYLPVFIGVLIWILFFVLIIKKFYHTHAFLFSIFLFLILSSITAALFRLNHSETTQALSSRYGIFSVMVMVVSILCLIQLLSFNGTRSMLRVLFIVSPVYYLGTAIFFYPEVVLRKQRLVEYISSVKEGKEPLKEIFTPDNAGEILSASCKLKIYCP